MKLTFLTLFLIAFFSEHALASKCSQSMSEIREEIHSNRAPFKSPPPYEQRIIVLNNTQRAHLTALYLKHNRTSEEVFKLFGEQILNSKKHYLEPFTPEFVLEMLDTYFGLENKLNSSEKADIKKLSDKYKKSIAEVKLEYAKALMFKKPLYEPLKHGAVIQLLTYAYNLNKTLDEYLSPNHTHKVK